MDKHIDETGSSESDKDMEQEIPSMEDLDHSGQHDQEQLREAKRQENQETLSKHEYAESQLPSDLMDEDVKEGTADTKTNKGTYNIPRKNNRSVRIREDLVVDGSFVPRTLFDFNIQALPSPQKKSIARKKTSRPKETAPAVEEKSPIFSQTTMKYLKSSGLHSKRLENLLMKYLGPKPPQSTLSE